MMEGQMMKTSPVEFDEKKIIRGRPLLRRGALMFAVVTSIVVQGQPLPAFGTEDEQEGKLQKWKEVPADVTMARKQFGEIFLLAKSTKRNNPKEAEALLQAALSGLVSIGDMETFAKVRGQLQNPNLFESRITLFCEECASTGRSLVQCSTCKGQGKCQVSICENGVRKVQLLTGGTMNQKFSVCNGTGKCNDCGGSGKKVVICRRCMGRKNYDKAAAREAYGLYLTLAGDLMLGSDSQEDKIFADMDSRRTSAKEVHGRKVATVVAKKEQLNEGKERKISENSGNSYMTTLSGPKSAHGGTTSSGTSSSGDGKGYDIAWEKAKLKWEIEDLKSKGASPEEIAAAEQRFRDKARENGQRLLDHKPVIIRQQKGGMIRDIVIDDGRPLN